MKNLIKTIYPLVIIAVFFGAALGMTYQLLEKKIDETIQKEENDALTAVLPQAAVFEKITNTGEPYYIGYDSQKNIAGYVFKKAKIGYGGPVVTLVGVKPDRSINSVFVLSAASETPGLGNKCTEKAWQSQFTNLTADKVPGSKADFSKYGLDIITGATITSMAVADNLKLAFEQLKAVAPVGIPGAMTNTNTQKGGTK
jgi:RnfABCDGE-type electron transport complex G subunit